MGVRNLVLMGISTGGPKTLRSMFAGMRRLNAALVLVQHMPRFINRSVCKTLAGLSPNDVVLAEDGQNLRHGTIHVAPSERHVELAGGGAVRLTDGPKVCFVKPAADVLMQSARKPSGLLIGIVMTGMGRDGAEGIRHVKRVGGQTIAQDRATCVIDAMPSAAIETGQVDFVLSPEGIRDQLHEMVA